jgi:hypothetical protein
LKGKLAVAVPVDQEEPVFVIGRSVSRKFVTREALQFEELAVELSEGPGAGGVQGGVHENRIVGH